MPANGGGMKTAPRALARQPHSAKAAAASTPPTRPQRVAAGKVAQRWRFAPDAIGMMSGPRDLSLREGFGA